MLADSKANKAFKSDSQRLAFFIPSFSSVFMVVVVVVVVVVEDKV